MSCVAMLLTCCRCARVCCLRLASALQLGPFTLPTAQPSADFALLHACLHVQEPEQFTAALAAQRLTALVIDNCDIEELLLGDAVAGRLRVLGISGSRLQDAQFLQGCTQLQQLALSDLCLGGADTWLSDDNLQVGACP